MGTLHDHPFLWFVIATLLPLASFTYLLLVGGVRNFVRARRNHPAADAVYQGLGGDQPGRRAAYVGMAAIFLAFVCSATGYVTYFLEHHHLEDVKETADSENETHDKDLKTLRRKGKNLEGAEAKENSAKMAELRKKIKENEEAKHEAEEHLEHRWSGSILWARVWSSSAVDPGSGNALRIGARIDHLSGLMFVMVTFVATLIHLFSSGYMSEELDKQVEDHQVHGEDGGHFKRRGRFGRFFLFLSLFCFSMLNLLLADNLFQIFVSWELVGICSFLLIGFYYERTSATNAANKAFITNRVGDAGFIIGLLIVWTYLGTFNFEEMFSRLRAPVDTHHGHVHAHGGHHKQTVTDLTHRFVKADATKDIAGGKEMTMKAANEAGQYVVIMPRPMEGEHEDEGHQHYNAGELVDAKDRPKAGEHGYMPYWMLVVAGLGIFLGCVGKSAQFPLQVWLPDAMEGPTPVSALIHAATMVAAGVYLVGRCYPLFAPETLLTIAYTGGITLFVAATIAIVATDIKKVLAYSTVSQLGYMMLGLGVGGWAAGLFHLVTHAFFKALLFLGSGSVIYGCHHEQDMRKMGGLFPKMKITAISMLMGVFAIAGIPLFSGWYSKDAVLANAFGFIREHPQHVLLFVLPLITAGITTFYMFRMWFMTFAGRPKDHHVYDHAHETPWMMTTPLVLLAILSVGVAWGNPPWDATKSFMETQILHHAQPASVGVDFGAEHDLAHKGHDFAGGLALVMVVIGFAFAASTYWFGFLDPNESKEMFSGVHRFLSHKWYFDEVYSALLVRPAMAVAGWARWFDTNVVDGLVNGVGKSGLAVSRVHGFFDRVIVDGLVNLVAGVWYSIGSWLRVFQTGYIRSYVLFLGMAAAGIWLLLWVLTMAPAAPP